MERERRSLQRDFGDLEVQMGVRDVTSPIAVLAITDFGTNWGKGLGIASVGREAPVLASNPLFHFSGDLRVRDPLEAQTGIVREEEARDQTYQRDSGRS